MTASATTHNPNVQAAEWTRDLARVGACSAAIDWAGAFVSLDEAWAKCDRGDWMLWLWCKLHKENEIERMTLAVCKCARLALQYIPKEKTRPLRFIEAAEKWARGETPLDELIEVSDCAFQAADEARSSEQRDNAVAYALCPADVACFTAACAHPSKVPPIISSAAYNAAAAAYWGAYNRERSRVAANKAAYATLKACADIVREFMPEPPEFKRHPERRHAGHIGSSSRPIYGAPSATSPKTDGQGSTCPTHQRPLLRRSGGIIHRKK